MIKLAVQAIFIGLFSSPAYSVITNGITHDNAYVEFARNKNSVGFIYNSEKQSIVTFTAIKETSQGCVGVTCAHFLDKLFVDNEYKKSRANSIDDSEFYLLNLPSKKFFADFTQDPKGSIGKHRYEVISAVVNKKYIHTLDPAFQKTKENKYDSEMYDVSFVHLIPTKYNEISISLSPYGSRRQRITENYSFIGYGKGNDGTYLRRGCRTTLTPIQGNKSGMMSALYAPQNNEDDLPEGGGGSDGDSGGPLINEKGEILGVLISRSKIEKNQMNKENCNSKDRLYNCNYKTYFNTFYDLSNGRKRGSIKLMYETLLLSIEKSESPSVGLDPSQSIKNDFGKTTENFLELAVKCIKM